MNALHAEKEAVKLQYRNLMRDKKQEHERFVSILHNLVVNVVPTGHTLWPLNMSPQCVPIVCVPPLSLSGLTRSIQVNCFSWCSHKNNKIIKKTKNKLQITLLLLLIKK